MMITLGFDVYGTLIDTAGITEALRHHVGDNAPRFSALWRDKQLEYSFRRGLMQNYQHFGICTRQALDFVCSQLDYTLSSSEKDELMANYRILPAFPDAREALNSLDRTKFNCFAFSNGRRTDVCNLLENSGISSSFTDVISTDEIMSFKPNPAVYAHFLRRTKSSAQQAWLISGNPFDVIGAISSGMGGVWVQRQKTTHFDPWEIQPTVTISQLGELAGVIEKCNH